MNELLQLAVDAHGGLSRRNQLKWVKASLSITGAIWQVKIEGGAGESSAFFRLAGVPVSPCSGYFNEH